MDNNNIIVYCINSQVDFIPAQNKLISRETGNVFTTYVTASRCLHLLICYSGKMVPHKLLYEAGWENHGKIVTPNTLYQTISELRKQLKNAGLKKDIIHTYPRRGWGISEDLIIEERTVPAAGDQALLSKSVKKNNLRTLCKKLCRTYPLRLILRIL